MAMKRKCPADTVRDVEYLLNRILRSVLAAGSGTWDGTIVNPNNPQRRDVNLLPALGYLVRLLSRMPCRNR